MLGGLDDLVVPVGALDEPHRERVRAPGARAARPVEHRVERLGRVAQVGLQDHPRRRPLAELRLGEQLQHQLEHGVAGVERLHVDVQVRADLAGAAQEPAEPVGGVALAALGRVGAQEGRERGDLHREVRARQRAVAVALERRALGPRRGRAGDRDQRGVAALRVALRLGLRDGRLAEQVDRARHPVLPQVAQGAERRPGALADDEAVRHVLDARRGGGAERGAARARVAHAHRDGDRRRLLLDLAQEAGEVAREVVERAAGGHDVDEAEQRGLQLGVLRGELHGLLVGGLERVPRRRRERGPEPLADRVQLALERGVVHGANATPRTVAGIGRASRGRSTSVASAPMQELADALAERLGAPVAIEDRRYRMLAYSAHAEAPDRVRLASILTREAPSDLAAWLDANGLPDAEAPVRLAPPPELGMGPRVAVPIPGRLGYVWLVDDGRVGEEELAAATATAGAAATAIRDRREAERTERALVGALLAGDHEAARRLRERGLRGPVRVVAGPDLAHRRLVTGERAALFAGTDAELDALGLALGASAPRERLEEAPAALREAELAASLRGRGRVVRWEALGALQLLAPLAGAPVPERARAAAPAPGARRDAGGLPGPRRRRPGRGRRALHPPHDALPPAAPDRADRGRRPPRRRRPAPPAHGAASPGSRLTRCARARTAQRRRAAARRGGQRRGVPPPHDSRRSTGCRSSWCSSTTARATPPARSCGRSPRRTSA